MLFREELEGMAVMLAVQHSKSERTVVDSVTEIYGGCEGWEQVGIYNGGDPWVGQHVDGWIASEGLTYGFYVVCG